MRGVAGALKRGQRNAEALMIDLCVVSRVETVEDPDDGSTADSFVPVWSGKCKLTTYEPDAVVLESAGRPVTTQEYRLHVPLAAGPFRIGDVAVIAGDPRAFRVDGLFQKTWATAQRLKVTELANGPKVGVLP